jgi:hypothetical protein
MTEQQRAQHLLDVRPGSRRQHEGARFAARFSRATCSFRVSGSSASALESATISGLLGEPVPVGVELLAHDLVGLCPRARSCLHEVEEHPAALDVAEEAVAEPAPSEAPSIRPGMSASTNSRPSPHHPEARDAGS